MKRNEMIDIIIKSSKDYNPLSPVNFHQADCILQAIEKHGDAPAGTLEREKLWYRSRVNL